MQPRCLGLKRRKHIYSGRKIPDEEEAIEHLDVGVRRRDIPGKLSSLSAPPSHPSPRFSPMKSPDHMLHFHTAFSICKSSRGRQKANRLARIPHPGALAPSDTLPCQSRSLRPRHGLSPGFPASFPYCRTPRISPAASMAVQTIGPTRQAQHVDVHYTALHNHAPHAVAAGKEHLPYDSETGLISGQAQKAARIF